MWDGTARYLTDRTALVTGGGAGMGRAHALALARCGAHVLVQDIRPEGAAETSRQVVELGGRATPLCFDVSNVAETRKYLSQAVALHGPVTIVINNAGIFDEYKTDDLDEATFWRMLNIHVRGTFFATQQLVAGMKTESFGRIVNISSNWGMVGHEISPHYAAAKAAILGFTKSWAVELAPWGITSNAIGCGAVLTGMVLGQKNIEETLPGRFAKVPLGRFAEPHEIASIVSFLVSPPASFISGQTINATGGETIVGI